MFPPSLGVRQNFVKHRVCRATKLHVLEALEVAAKAAL
jgi:hypothetical protein